MKRSQIEQGRRALELIEEAVHLLRQSRASALFSYYLGSFPFVLGLLFFWAEMSRSADAARRLPLAALGLALLFLWMKLWQSVFARQMLAQACGQPPPLLGLRDLLRTLLSQGIVQPSGLFLLPLAAMMLVPFGWVYAFYQSATVAGADEEGGVWRLVKKAAGQAALWPKQNHCALIALKAFGLFVFIDLATGFLSVPFLLKSLLGIETVFSRSWGAMLNSTFLAAMAGLAYLCLDPLLKSFYVLRCFHGESLRSGEDLRAELRAAAGALPTSAAAVALALGLAVLAASPASAADAGVQSAVRPQQDGSGRRPASSATQAVTPAELDRSMGEVIGHREYRWRLPREKLAETAAGKSALGSLVDNVVEVMRDWTQKAWEWLRKALKWIFGNREPYSRSGSVGTGWISQLHWVLVALLAVLVVILVVMLFRIWQHRVRKEEVTARAEPAVPDVADENVGADQLPEDEWSRLARDLIERGDLRLALRAYYLASLAHLATRNLVSLARFKSNRDYERELNRRSHALPEVADRFSANVSVFDRTWYGLHEVTRDLLDQFAGNVEKIKAQT